MSKHIDVIGTMPHVMLEQVLPIELFCRRDSPARLRDLVRNRRRSDGVVASLFGWQKLPHGQGYSSILKTIRFHSEAEIAFQLVVELRQVAAVHYCIPP